MGMTPFTVTAESVRLSGTQWGDQPGEIPVVLLHGFGGASSLWEPCAQAWSPRRTVVAFDLPGHVMSAMPDYAFDRQVESIALALRAVTAGPVHLVGYSMGARLALALALSAPACVASLVLDGCHPGIRGIDERLARRRLDEQWARLLESDPIEEFSRRWDAQPVFAAGDSASLRDRLGETRRRHNPTLLAGSMRGAGLAAQPDLWLHLTRLTMPVLWLSGAADTKFGALADEAVRLVPQGIRHSFPNTGHRAHLDTPQVYARVVENFWLDTRQPLQPMTR